MTVAVSVTVLPHVRSGFKKGGYDLLGDILFVFFSFAFAFSGLVSISHSNKLWPFDFYFFGWFCNGVE